MPNRVLTADDGFALVAVLVFMLVVSAIVAPFAIAARTRLMIAGNQTEHERLALLADGLANVVSAQLVQGLWPAAREKNSSSAGCRSGQFSFEVRVQNHAGLIDLNAAGRDDLAAGFTSLGLSQEVSNSLADSVIRSRSPVSVFGSVFSTRAELESDRHGPFESVSELQELASLPSVPLAALYNTFTIHSRQGAIDLDNAPEVLLAAIAHRKPRISEFHSEALAYTVNVVTRREGSGIVGQAGLIVEKAAAANSFRRLALYPKEETVDAGDPITMVDCTELFGPSVNQVLKEWTR